MGILDHPSSSSSSGSQPGHPRGAFGIEWGKWFPPVTSRSFLSHYLPASGAISHTLYTVHLFSPNIISSLFPTGDLAISNTILFNANVGLGFYVYFRRHLHRANPWERVEFSVLSSTLFNFGSLLAAVLIKALFPAKSPTWLRSLTATVLSGYLLSRSAKYMGLLDARSFRGSVSPARSVLSKRQTAVLSSSSSSPAAAAAVTAPSRSVSSSSANAPSSEELCLDTTFSPSYVHLDNTPRSNESSYMPMTPSVTEHTASEFGRDSVDVGEEEEGIGMAEKQNYRYLHSYGLNNLNHGRPKKETILRRTTMNQNGGGRMMSPQKAYRRSSEVCAPLCFVTPEPSLKEVDDGVYPSPPSRMDFLPKSHAEKSARSIKSNGKSRAARKSAKIPHEVDEFDHFLDMVQWHAPLALVPIAFGCWVTGTVPMLATIRFIFFA